MVKRTSSLVSTEVFRVRVLVGLLGKCEVKGMKEERGTGDFFPFLPSHFNLHTFFMVSVV